MENVNVVVSKINEVSENVIEFNKLHNEILLCASSVCEYIVMLSKKLKEMHDKKIYLDAGYNSFSEYCEKAVGIKERQAYKYIKVCEELPEDFLHSNAKLGITKLEMIASVPDDQRDELVLKAENISVKQLKLEIEEKNNYINEIENNYKSIIDDLNNKVKNNQEEIERLEKTCVNNNEIINNKILIEKEKEIKNNKKLIESKIEDIKNLKKQIDDLKNKSVVIEKVIDSDKENQYKSEISDLKKQLCMSLDENVIKYKVKFEEIQRVIYEMKSILKNMTEDNRVKCTAATKAILGEFNNEL